MVDNVPVFHVNRQKPVQLLLHIIFFLKAVYAAADFVCFLLPRVNWVKFRACVKYDNMSVFRMNIFLHFMPLLFALHPHGNRVIVRAVIGFIPYLNSHKKIMTVCLTDCNSLSLFVAILYNKATGLCLFA